MNTMLTHPYEYFKLHLHLANATDKASPQIKRLQRVFALAEQGAKIAFVFAITYIAFCCFAKLVEAEALSVYFCDFCSALPVILVAP